MWFFCCRMIIIVEKRCGEVVRRRGLVLRWFGFGCLKVRFVERNYFLAHLEAYVPVRASRRVGFLAFFNRTLAMILIVQMSRLTSRNKNAMTRPTM